MPCHNLLNIISNVNSPDVKRPVLPHEAPHSTHIIPIVTVLISPEAINIRIEQIMYPWQSVQVLALMALGTDSTRKEQTKVAAGYFVGARIAAVARDAASRRRGVLG